VGGQTLAAVAQVLAGAGVLVGSRGDLRTEVAGASQDSTNTAADDLFCAWKGSIVDAHDFLPVVARRGASGAVVERAVESVQIPQLVVSDGRRAAAVAAAFLADHPDRSMTMVGITGTNGKTTTSLITRHLLGRLGPAAAVGTVGVVGARTPAEPGSALTTPGPVETAATLRSLADAGTVSVTMEASSHALDQRRLDGIEFDIGVFTNFTQDHLDYHGDLASYLDAKKRLTELIAADGSIVVNADDPAWNALDGGGRRMRTFSLAGGEASVGAEDVAASSLGSEFTCRWYGERISARLPLPGRFNVSNALAALSVAELAGVDRRDAVALLAEAPQVPGRLERVVETPFSVYIDFAHTADALKNVLATLKPLTKGRLIVVFGAGGDRDRGKRAQMGAAARLADTVVLTSDNPRGEDPERIMDDIAAGLGGTRFARDADRRRAISLAIDGAEPGDTVLLAGKGHERYQIFAEGSVPFDEREVVLEAVGKRAAGGGGGS